MTNKRLGSKVERATVAPPPQAQANAMTLADLATMASGLERLMGDLREQILAPRPRKEPPRFTAVQVAALCGLDRSQVLYRATKPAKEGEPALPPGTIEGAGRSRTFSLQETREWIRAVGPHPEKPAGLPAEVVLLCNFKGGSTKTTTTMSLAQSLTLRGRKVLVIDLDPQASLTELCGLYAEKDVEDHETVLPLFYGDVQSLRGSIQSTYWDGLSIVPSSRLIYDADFAIAGSLPANPKFAFWDVLRKGLDDVRMDFDYILIDTAPSLSFLTLNALMASNAILMPLVPESLDFISSVQFWRLLSDLSGSFQSYGKAGEAHTFDFVRVLHSKVDTSSTSNAQVVKLWSEKAYGDKVLDIEIPASTLVGSEALEFSTVYDISRWTGNARTLQRIKDPFDQLGAYIDNLFVAKWERQS